MNTPATDTDSLSGLQWDMAQIHAPQAHAITGGSKSVLAGDIDTGLDYTHPDLAANVDSANSVNCVSGVPVPGAVAANDDNGHGTHTAGTIAAASNGIGIVGVAPNVRIAGIKAGNAAGFFFPEAVVCSFVWAGTHGFDVTNNSYFADPWLFNCKNDPVQRAIWTAERRAIKFAQQNGVLVVAAEGNQSDDLSHPTQDATSPDDTTPVIRDITNACAVVPVEVPGVVGVSADGNAQQDGGGYLKSFYSSFGDQRDRPRRSGWGLVVRPHARFGERPRALDLAGLAVDRHLPPGKAARRRERRDVLLPAGNVDGVAARCRRRGADRQPVRQTGRAERRDDAALEGRFAPPADGRPAAVPVVASGRVRGVRRCRRRSGADLPGRDRAQLVVRSRAGERAQRDHAQHVENRAIETGPGLASRQRPGPEPCPSTPAHG